jgi:acetyl-CoA carboxylase carboxyltransferase component
MTSPVDVPLLAPFAGTVIAVAHGPDERLAAGAAVVVLEAMKMEHEVVAEHDGVVVQVEVSVGDAVREGQLLAVLAADAASQAAVAPEPHRDLQAVRADLAAVRERHRLGLDAGRPDAVGRRHERGRQTARENLGQLVDEGTFVEYGPLAFAAQEGRRSKDELIARTPADGLVAGVGGVDGERCVVMSYDYTVLAGTQGMRNHLKKDRLFELAARGRLPVVLFAEGGGGRPGDVDWPVVAGLDCRAFHLFARLSGSVPLIVQYANGVVDLRVADDREAIGAAKRYLGYFRRGGPAASGTVGDQRILRQLVPANRKRIYDVRAIIDALFDEGSVLELRRGFGPGMVTALGRMDGASLGVVANDPSHLGGAIDAEGADKAARFMRGCDAFDLPIVFPCDTPGFMVGPAAEQTATVRHFARMFVTGANLEVPTGTIVLRKGYGLGAQAMAGGGSRRRCSPSPGRRRSSARWASRDPCVSACAASWRRLTIPPSASARSMPPWPRPTSAARESTWPRTSRSMT